VITSARPVDFGGIVILIAGALAILGSFLRWITATAAFVGTIGRSGLDGGGDGIVTIALGIVIVLLGIAMLARSGSRRTARIGAIVCAVVLGFIAYIDIKSVNDRIAGLGDNVNGALGMGLILVAFAAVLTVIGAFLPSGQDRVAATVGPTSARRRRRAAGSLGGAQSGPRGV
jgi:hypothetical protein